MLATFTVTNGSDAGPGSLREAIDLSNALPGTDFIDFQNVAEVRLTKSQLSITDPLTIDGSGIVGGVTVTAADADPDPSQAGNGIRVFEVVPLPNSSDPVTFHHLNISGGDVAGSGGAIATDHAIVLVDTTVSQNSATVDGGGISVLNADLTITNSVIDSNVSDNFGGGIRFRATEFHTFEIQGSILSGNSAPGIGGALYLFAPSTEGANIQIESTIVENNTARFGSGLRMSLPFGGTGRIEAATIRNNTTVDRPGYTSASAALGVDISGMGLFEIVDCVIEGNTSTYNAGASLSARYGAEIQVSGVVVKGNVAERSAGGIGISASYDGKVLIKQSTISGNSAGVRGGGLDLSNDGYFYSSITIRDSLISDNEAGLEGGGVFSSSFGYGYLPVTTIGNTTMSGNRAGNAGGGIFAFAHDSVLRLDNSTVANNSAAVNGGGIVTDGFASYFGVRSTIAADNVSAGGNQDDLSGEVDAVSSLIEMQTSGTPISGPGNILGVDPGLGPLQDNGGATLTHGLTFASPAVDAGAIFAGTPAFDQRGAPFDRVVRSVSDIGAFEWQPLPGPLCDFDLDGECDLVDIDALITTIALGKHDPAFDLTFDGLVNLDDRDEWLALAGVLNLPSRNPYLLGDANLDGIVDAEDFILWNNNKFTNVAAWSAADFNADGVVDAQDFIVWNANKFTSSVSRSQPLPRQDARDVASHADRTLSDVNVPIASSLRPRDHCLRGSPSFE